MFLTSKIQAGSEFEILIVNSSGLVADLVLSVRDIEGQIINIQDASTLKANESKAGQELANMLKAMIMDDPQEKYYVRVVKRPLQTSQPTGLSVIQDRSYRYENLIGARLVVKNVKGVRGQAIELKETDFMQMFESVKAVSLGSNVVHKNSSSYVWVITKDGSIR